MSDTAPVGGHRHHRFDQDRNDSGAWHHELVGAGAILSLAPIGSMIAVDDLYRTAGLDLP